MSRVKGKRITSPTMRRSVGGVGWGMGAYIYDVRIEGGGGVKKTPYLRKNSTSLLRNKKRSDQK